MAKDTGFNLWDSIFHTRKEQPEEQQAPPEEKKNFSKATLPEKPEWLKQRARQEKCREDVILEQAAAKMTKNLRSEYEAAIELLKTIPGWKNADELLQQCRKALADRAAIEAAERQQQNKNANRSKKRLLFGFIAIIVAITLVITPTITRHFISSPESIMYYQALARKEEGNLVEAYKLFRTLDGYRDSKDQIKYLFEGQSLLNYRWKGAPLVTKGETLRIGNFDQDGNPKTEEPVEWIVLDVQRDKVLVLSKYILTAQVYDSTAHYYVDWNNSKIRSELQYSLLYDILKTEWVPSVLPTAIQSESGYRDSKLFILDSVEWEKYRSIAYDRIGGATATAVAAGVMTNTWWLRDQGEYFCYAKCVKRDFLTERDVRSTDIGVRPAMWISWELLPAFSGGAQ